MTNKTFKEEVKSIGKYLGCNEEELWSEMKQVLDLYKQKILEALPKETNYKWEDSKCSVCHYNSYYDDNPSHRCEINDKLLSEVKQIIENI